MSHQAQELDVARQKGKAGKGAEDGASCAKSLLLAGSFCWKGWREPRLEAKSCILLLGMEWEHEALPAGSSDPAPSCSGGRVKPISQLILTTGFCEATISFWGNV